MATRTLLQVLHAVSENLAARSYGTATAGASGTLTCATHPFITALATADANEFVGDQIYIHTGVGLGQARQITAYAPTTGVFTVSPAWATNPTSTSEFSIFKRGLARDWLRDRINEALVKLRYLTIAPLTLVTDGDMETSGVGSWTASNATLTKVTGASTLLRQTQSLRVLNSGAGGYGSTVPILCRSSQEWYVQVDVRADVGTARLSAYDVTNSATITSETYAYRGWGRIAFTFTTPATCESINFILSGSGAADDTYWDNLIAYPTGITEIQLPSWITRPGQVHKVLTDAQRDPEHDEDRLREAYWWKLLPDYSNPNSQFRLSIAPTLNGPVWLEAARPFSTLTLDADTTFCDQEWIEVAATVEALDKLINLAPSQEVSAWKQEYNRKRAKLAYLNAALMPPMVVRHQFPERPNTPVNAGI